MVFLILALSGPHRESMASPPPHTRSTLGWLQVVLLGSSALGIADKVDWIILLQVPPSSLLLLWLAEAIHVRSILQDRPKFLVLLVNGNRQYGDLSNRKAGLNKVRRMADLASPSFRGPLPKFAGRPDITIVTTALVNEPRAAT